MKKKISIALVFHYSYYFRLFLISRFSTPYCRILLRLKGVKVGHGSTFIGVPFVYLFPDSKISMGRCTEIRTAQISNFIGINRRTTISTHSKYAQILVGDNCGMSGVVIGAKQSILIGNNVLIGANVLITDFDWHSIDAVARNQGASSESKPVIIADNVFIGYSATILKGVSIGENSVIGANSVVTSNIPANVIAAGNPCRIISGIGNEKKF